MFIRVNVTDVRPRLTALLGQVEHAGQRVVIARHGTPVAVIVSMADFARISTKEDEELYGPVNPETGRRRGIAWVRKTGWKPARGKKGAERVAEQKAPPPRRWWRWW